MDGKRCGFVFLLWLSLFASGCGGGASPETGSEAGAGTASPPANPPAVIPEDPVVPVEDGGVGINVITHGKIGLFDPVVIGLDKAIDPESIGDGFVLRSLDALSVIPLHADYSEADQVLTLTPRIPLAAGSHYVLELGDMKILQAGASGSNKSLPAMPADKDDFKPLPPVVSTRRDLLESSITYDDETGEITSYWTYRYHDEGEVWRIVDMYTGPGIDGDWFETADNERSGSFVTERPAGEPYLKIWYESPGKTGGWSPGNGDVVKEKTVYEDSGMPGAESYINSMDAGPDGEWFTDDDEYNVVHIRCFDETSRTMHYIFGNSSVENLGPGNDGIWGTGDDAIEYHEKRIFDDELRPLRVERYRKGLNDDGDWYSADDQLYRYIDYEYDGSGRVSNIRMSYRPQPSQETFVPGSHDSFQYSGEKRHYLRSISHDPVTGDIWSYVQHDRTEDGVLLRYGVFHGRGPDQQWFTNYDSSGNLSENIIDDQELVQATWHYDGLGGDMLRYSGDEAVDSLTINRYDEQGNLVASEYFTSPGEDNVWNTADDVKRFHDTYLQEPVLPGD